MTLNNEHFWQLLKPNFTPALKFCHKLSGNNEQGDDLMQESLLTGIKKFNQLNDEISLVYYNHSVPQGTNLTYQLDALPTNPTDPDSVVLFHFDNLVSYGEDSTNFHDFSNNSNNGICTGDYCPTPSPTGRFAGALDFDGVDDVVLVNEDQPMHSENAFSISMWIYPYDDASNGGQALVDHFFYIFGAKGYAIYLRDGTVNFIVGNNSDLYLIETVTGPINSNKWSFITATFNNGILKLYLNFA